jgi:hypothetical protein
MIPIEIFRRRAEFTLFATAGLASSLLALAELSLFATAGLASSLLALAEALISDPVLLSGTGRCQYVTGERRP